MPKVNKFLCVFALAASVCFSGNVYAADNQMNESMAVTQQKRKVTGVINDDFGPVAGASIAVKGTTTGTISNFDGEFSIDVSDGQTLVISFIGYIPQEIVVSGQTTLNITLREDTQTLDEVVVTALGMKRSTKALGYAMTELKGDEVAKTVINPVSALQGKVAGVSIAGSDGGLFGSSRILIRGASTLNKNNQPIYVIDGVILDNATKNGDADWTDTDRDWGNELKNLNPDDFETISVLKGAASTALYGSRGLNGAVVITTKSGKGKKGLGISFSQTFGIDHVYDGPAFQNKYGSGNYAGNIYLNTDENGNYIQWDTNQFKYNASGNRSLIGQSTLSFGPAYDGQPIENFDYTSTPYSAKKNNFVDAYDNGFNTNTNVAVQGSNDTSSFYTSLSYRYANGTTPNNSFERLSFLVKAAHKITEKVELEAGVAFANSTPKGGETNFGEKFLDGTWSRQYDSRYWRNRYKGAHGGLASSSYGDEYGYAPGRGTWWNIYEIDRTQKETSVRPSLKLNIELTDWLKFNAEGNYNYYYKRYEEKELGSGYANDGGSYKMELYTKEQTNANVNLLANKSFGDWAINGFLRGEYYHNFEQAMSENTNGGLIVPGQYFIGNSKNPISYSGKIQGEKTILSVAGQVGVSYKDQVFLDITGRNDWSSSLVYSDSHGTYSYFYPSVSASWLIHETFRDDLPHWISFMKLRGSWAQVGHDTDSYKINTAYSIITSTTNSGNTYGLEIPTTSYSTDLKPERKNAWEVGLDWRFVNNRFGFDVTYYKENTKDQIMSIAVPSVSGISNQLINAGNIQNQGIEIALNTTPIQTKDWVWDLNLTFMKNKSKIVELHENVADYIGLEGMPAYGNYRIGSVAKVGGEYGLLMSDSSPMIDKNTGLPVLSTAYYNYNNMHAVYHERAGEVQEVGSMMPDFEGGLNTSLTYKNWSLRAQFDFRFGGHVAIYNSKYGTAYGFLEESMKYRDTENGGTTFTSIWDGKTYHDGYMPVGIIQGGTTLNTPSGSYTVAEGGETYESLFNKGLVDYQHASSWTRWNNAWGTGTINDAWFKELNYIALREIAVSYRMPMHICKKIGSNGMTLTAAGRNLGYLLNSLPNNINPESVRGTQAGQFMIRSANPYVANYTFTINVTF
ncbi:SusC/RagA family TonB-linked outer membrane protein [Parabacteroides sp. PF5-6]|uniref:SusC/RagA family TonB-linked outer membrane protein n=1 Tax=Parabacteroides sp. PF5-6 TaxID=1742403 RepID=UPI0024052E4B|nr:SusC/RagA family TonB-linked outer membrane protein [Parabacteroides sp. PF5-6]MDF9831772.1 iron complex outermembrane receptor protein [Parabacteroides sp. PF5-6]